MPEHRQRFEIDNHLGRHNKAIKSLHALQAYQDLKVYTVKHSLYSDALDLYADQPELFREMAELHADHLHDQSNHREAAIGKPHHILILLVFGYGYGKLTFLHYSI